MVFFGCDRTRNHWSTSLGAQLTQKLMLKPVSGGQQDFQRAAVGVGSELIFVIPVPAVIVQVFRTPSRPKPKQPMDRRQSDRVTSEVECVDGTPKYHCPSEPDYQIVCLTLHKVLCQFRMNKNQCGSLGFFLATYSTRMLVSCAPLH